MNNKIIIVGASSGMGRKLAEIYLSKGCRIGVTGRRQKLLEEIKQLFPEHAEYECFDVTGNENIPHLEKLVVKLGGLDLLIICAGIGEPSAELKWSLDKIITDTNVKGFIEIANWAFNFFVKQEKGHLVNISSVAANRGSSYSPSYAASKAFQSTYFEGLSIKARRMKKDIVITCIEPGFVNTKMAHGGEKMFWVAAADKAVRQILHAIEKKKRKAYVTRRWWVVAKAMRWAPWWLYKRFG